MKGGIIMLQLKKKKGRPCKGRGPQDQKRTYRFTKEECSKFDIVVKNRGLTHTEFIKKAIDYAWNKDFLD